MKFELTLTDQYLLLIEDMIIIAHLPLIESGVIHSDGIPLLPSLSQLDKFPKWFKAEMKCGRCYMPLTVENENNCFSAKECSKDTDFKNIILTQTNHLGQTELVGKYIY